MALLAVGLGLTSCTAGDPSDAAAREAQRQPAPSRAAVTPAVAVLVPRERVGWFGGRCVESTQAGSPQTPTPELVEFSRQKDWYGGAGLWVTLPLWGGQRREDGTIDHKIGWWRTVAGDLQIVATRLDGLGTARPDVPQGYGSSGFQASGVNFSGPGCWRVVGMLHGTRLPFVISVHA